MKQFYLILFAIVAAKALHDDKIVTGEPIDILQAPYQASLRVDGRFTCGGSLISERFVLTAANCIDKGFNANRFTVQVGSDHESTGGISIVVKAYIRHQGYRLPERQHDIALLLLEEKVIESNTTKFIELNSNPIPVGTRAFITGWGSNADFLAGIRPQALLGGYVTIIHQEDCKKYFEFTIYNTQICAQDMPTDSCDVDSGGPMVANFKLVGIISYGYGCKEGHMGSPGVYTRVSEYINWIHENMKILNLQL